jgi:FkbM family methyltransferase
MSLRTQLRAAFAAVARRLPIFRGLGRVVLLMDRLLTDRANPESYMDSAVLNHSCRLNLDLRCREQLFAFYYGRWEHEFIKAVQRHYHHGEFYDVGASIGLYAATFGQICRDRGNLLRAFEPVPSNRERLKSQLELNRLSEQTVQLEPLALGETTWRVQLTLVDDGRPGNAKIVSHGEVEVEVSTLDLVWQQFGCESVGFIKIDTEGWDARIIDGGRKLIAACRPDLLIEFNRERMGNLKIPLEPVWQFLVEELHYACYRIDESGREHALSAPGDWENLLFVSPVSPMDARTTISPETVAAH